MEQPEVPDPEEFVDFSEGELAEPESSFEGEVSLPLGVFVSDFTWDSMASDELPVSDSTLNHIREMVKERGDALPAQTAA